MTLHTYIGGPAEPLQCEIGYFHSCPICGQPTDRRDLEAVLHHMDEVHAPLEASQAFRLVDDPALRAGLSAGRVRLAPSRGWAGVPSIQ